MIAIDLDQQFDVNEFFDQHFPELPKEARGLIIEILTLRNEIRSRIQAMEKPAPFFPPQIGATSINYDVLGDLKNLNTADTRTGQNISFGNDSMHFSTLSRRLFYTDDTQDINVRPDSVAVTTTEGYLFKRKPAMIEIFGLQDIRLINLLQAFRDKLKFILLEVERFEGYLSRMAS